MISILNEGGERTLSSGIKVVGKDLQSTLKRFRSEDNIGQSSNTQGDKSNSKFSRYENSQNEDMGDGVQDLLIAPSQEPKGNNLINQSSGVKDQADKKGKQVSSSAFLKSPNVKTASAGKFMVDAQKSYKATHDKEDRVHIPESFEYLATDSDTLSEKLRKIGAFGDEGQGCSKEGDKTEVHQMWLVNDSTEMNIEVITSKDPGTLKNASVTLDLGIDNSKQAVQHVTVSPEVFIPDDHIINTQESVISKNIPSPPSHVQDEAIEAAQKLGQEADLEPAHQVRRRSERLKKEISMTMLEKMEVMDKKRNLEGNTKSQALFSRCQNLLYTLSLKRLELI